MKTWRIQPCTSKTLAALYGVTEKAFRTQLKPLEGKIGKKHGYLYTVKQLMIIFDEYCTPAGIEIIYPDAIPVRKRGNVYRGAGNHSDAGGLMI
ncbi:MAG TPA: hypothetical protein VIN08_11745 [Ohtaekwangia sp.]|uniref:hypothetical protein n=1 Tax=Ohtaekwangia sp. TaxID=2066019 RepID=UPI002F920888